MGFEQEQWFQNSQLVVELYSDWIERISTPVVRPLSPEERIGYLAIDYVVRMEAGARDGLIDPGPASETYETVEAFKTLGLDSYAKDLQRALDDSRDEEALESTLLEISSTFDGREEIEAAVVALIRKWMS